MLFHTNIMFSHSKYKERLRWLRSRSSKVLWTQLSLRSVEGKWLSTFEGFRLQHAWKMTSQYQSLKVTNLLLLCLPSPFILRILAVIPQNEELLMTFQTWALGLGKMSLCKVRFKYDRGLDPGELTKVVPWLQVREWIDNDHINTLTINVLIQFELIQRY